MAAKFSQEVLPQFLNSAEKKLKAVGGEYFTGGEVSLRITTRSVENQRRGLCFLPPKLSLELIDRPPPPHPEKIGFFSRVDYESRQQVQYHPQLSYGDIAMFSVLDMLSNAQLMSNSGFDSVYSDILKTLSNCSSLTKMHGMVKNMPKIASYLQSRENYDW